MIENLNINLNISLKQWSDFVINHPKGNIFQTPEMYKIYLETKNFEPFIIYTEKDSNITGLLLAVILQEHSGIIGKLSARSIIIGGPLILENNSNYLSEILEKYFTFIKNKAIYSQFRNLWDWSEHKEFLNLKDLTYIPHLNITIDLSNKTIIEQNISKNKKRNIIKSKNKGLIFKEITSFHEFEKSVYLIKSTYKKIGLPCAPKEHFTTAYKELYSLNRLKTFGAFLHNELIGTRMELLYKDLIYDWYAGANENESNKYPNDFLIYHILLWGHENNFKIFDFGGAGKPNKQYGVREHKLKFSNNLIEYGRFERIHKKLLFAIGKFGLLFYKYINDLRS